MYIGLRKNKRKKKILILTKKKKKRNYASNQNFNKNMPKCMNLILWLPSSNNTKMF